MPEKWNGSGACPTCGRKPKRSSEANRRYWAIINLLSEKVKPNGQQFSPESFHTYLKCRFLGMRELQMPSGQAITVPVSSADLDTSEFNDYMTQCEAWAAEMGVYLED